jgi:long-chain acyl-CoA synthetase
MDSSPIDSAHDAAGALRAAFEVFADRPCIGQRERERSPDGRGELLPEYTRWMTYADVHEASRRLGAALVSLGIARQGDVIAICGASAAEWLVAYYAVVLAGMVVLPVHPATVFAREHFLAVIRTASTGRPVRVAVASRHLLSALHDSAAQDLLHTAIVYDDPPEAYAVLEARQRNTTAAKETTTALRVLEWKEIIKRSDGNRHAPSPRKADELALLLPTSGTSDGSPKLTIVTDGMLRQQARTVRNNRQPVVMLAYEPLRQTLDVLAKGGRIGVFSGSLDRLLEDAQALRPTVFGGMPTFWQGLYSHFQQELTA